MTAAAANIMPTRLLSVLTRAADAGGTLVFCGPPRFTGLRRFTTPDGGRWSTSSATVDELQAAGLMRRARNAAPNLDDPRVLTAAGWLAIGRQPPEGTE